MCGIAEAALAVSALSSAAGAIGGQQTAKAQEQSAKAAADLERQQLALQQQQIDEASAQESFTRRRQTDRALGQFMAAAGASGVTGVSLGRAQSAEQVNEALDLGIIEQNRENRQQQAGITGLQIGAKESSRINQARAGAPSLLSGALNVAGAGLSGFGSGLQIESALKKR